MSTDIGDLEQYVHKILQPDKEEINGTGFFCHPEGYILTCYHVIEPHVKAGKTEVNVIYQGENHQAQICKEYCIEDADIAVLRIVEAPPSLKYLPLDTHHRYSIGDNIHSFGYPQGYFSESGININGSVGGSTRLEGIKVNVMQITGLNLSNVDCGYSGAPVLNLKSKKVIGLICARYRGAQAFFVPLTTLLERWHALRDVHDVFKKIRSGLARSAAEELNKKLKDSRFIPLNLECGTIPAKREEREEREQARRWAHGRRWGDFDLKNLLSFSRSYILSSSVGTGKTTFLYWLITQLTSKETVPIFMTCAEFESINPRSWNEFKEQLIASFEDEFSKGDVEYFLDSCFRRGELFFLFDGLDQIKGNDYNNLVSAIFKIISGNHVIITLTPPTIGNI